MAHEFSEEAEEILDKEYPVHNHGFVRLVDYMGSDRRVVQAARVSYGEGTKNIRTDKGLIRYLMRHRHTSPFEQVELTFHAKMPIFVARQWVRHRTASLNEISGRYSLMSDEFYIPEEGDINYQSTDNKQGRSTLEVPKEEQRRVLDILVKGQEKAYENYEEIYNDGIAKELARINLPLSLYTQWYWKTNLHNLFHFLGLRMDAHAQKEIRDYADIMGNEMAKKVAPISWEAFEDYQLNAHTFSSKELKLLKGLLREGIDPEDLDIFKGVGFVTKKDGEPRLIGEGQDFKKKLIDILNLDKLNSGRD